MYAFHELIGNIRTGYYTYIRSIHAALLQRICCWDDITCWARAIV